MLSCRAVLAALQTTSQWLNPSVYLELAWIGWLCCGLIVVASGLLLRLSALLLLLCCSPGPPGSTPLSCSRLQGRELMMLCSALSSLG
jgi:hypothetical protein